MSSKTSTSSGQGMFERRMGRLAYFLGHIYTLLPFVVVGLIVLLMSSTDNTPHTSATIINVLSLIIGFASFLLIIPITISLYIRRLHDLNQSGFLALLYFVPVANVILALCLLFMPGTKGSNNYGKPVNSFDALVILGFKKP